MTKNIEADLASALAHELQTLQELESFKHADQAEVTLSLSDKAAANHATAIKTVERRIEKLINNELVPIIETIVANQRERVSTARKTLLDFQFNGALADAGVDTVKPETAAKVNDAFEDLEAGQAYQTNEELAEREGTDARDEAAAEQEAADRALETDAAF